MDIPFTDAHTHTLPEKENIFVCADLSSSVLPVLQRGKKYLFSLGIHPAKTGVETMTALSRKLQMDPGFSAIGECGFDKNLSIDLEKQKELFLQQASLAEELEKPLIIHCVKAWDILYACAKKFPVKERRWLIHSFRGDVILAKELLRHHFTLSLAPQMILNMPERTFLMKDLPFLLETDDTKEDIEFLYGKTGSICKIDTEEVKEKVYELFCNFFKYSGGNTNGN